MKLHVGNLARQITDAQLMDLATPYGTVSSATVVTDTGTGASKGFAFIEFASDDEGNAAIKGLDGRDVEGLTLRVSVAKPRKPAVQA